MFAPATALTALLLYVGWVRTRAFYGYFGVNSGALGLSPQDYILRSADVGLGAVVLLALAAGVLLALDWLLAFLLNRAEGRRWGRWARPALATVGAALTLAGLSSVTAEASVAATPPLTSAVLIAMGAVLLLRFGIGSPGQPAVFGPATGAFGLAVLLVVACWAANSYAQQIGTAAAVAIDQNPTALPVVTVFSDEPLDLPGAYISPAQVPKPDERTTYRYTGARLLTYGNDRWFLITESASPSYRSPVVVLRDTESVRVETAAPQRGGT